MLAKVSPHHSRVYARLRAPLIAASDPGVAPAATPTMASGRHTGRQALNSGPAAPRISRGARLAGMGSGGGARGCAGAGSMDKAGGPANAEGGRQLRGPATAG